MAKVLVVFSSDYGNTQKMADAFKAGVETVPGAIATLRHAEEVTQDEVVAHDALIVGSPVHMGSPDWKVKQFIDKVCSPLWMKNRMIGKVGGVFCTGSGYGNGGGGAELTLLALLNNLAELGLILIPLPKNTEGYAVGGLQWGPYGRSAGTHMEQVGVLPESLKTSMHHGANIARAVQAIEGKTIFVGET